MGLDLVVVSKAKSGCEEEWRSLVDRLFAGSEPTEAEEARFEEISIPAYASVGAPRVGGDPEADRWIIAAREAETPEEIAAVLEEFAGYHVLELADCDGIPGMSHGGLMDGLDETSLRGSALEACRDVLGAKLVRMAWRDMTAEQAEAYGRELLAAADRAEGGGVEPRRRWSLMDVLLMRRPRQPKPLERQLEIVREAGRWFVFWGSRGHPIRAWA